MAAFSKALGKSKWFNCFKLDVGSFEISKKNGGNEESVSHKRVVMDFSDDDVVKMAFPLDEDRRCRSKRKMLRRGFSRVVKGVLFQTSWTKKTRSKKCGEGGTSFGDLSSKLQKAFKFKKPPPKPSPGGELSPSDGSLGHSSISSLFTPSNSTALSSSPSSSSSSSPSMSNSRLGSERRTSDKSELNRMEPMKIIKKSISVKKNCGDYNGNIGVYFLLICLVGLVFCGKAFAIFCTATCLFLVPSRRHVNLVDSSVDFDFDSAQERRRRVITEGLRQRSRSL